MMNNKNSNNPKKERKLKKKSNSKNNHNNSDKNKTITNSKQQPTICILNDNLIRIKTYEKDNPVSRTCVCNMIIYVYTL